MESKTNDKRLEFEKYTRCLLDKFLKSVFVAGSFKIGGRWDPLAVVGR
jgi:hypothetical protein